MRVELAPAKNYSGAAAARSAARRLAAAGFGKPAGAIAVSVFICTWGC
jgi:hypothetical protein